MTTWKPVLEFPRHYEVSNEGRVRRTARGQSTSPGRILRGHDNGHGWLQVTMTVGGVRYTRKVHALVAEAFLGARPHPDDVVCHRDGVRGNNAVGNLRWDSQAGNVADTLAAGRHNMARKTECPQGHPYDAANTRHGTQKGRYARRTCRACAREYARRKYRAR